MTYSSFTIWYPHLLIWNSLNSIKNTIIQQCQCIGDTETLTLVELRFDSIYINQKNLFIFKLMFLCHFFTLKIINFFGQKILYIKFLNWNKQNNSENIQKIQSSWNQVNVYRDPYLAVYELKKDIMPAQWEI